MKLFAVKRGKVKLEVTTVHLTQLAYLAFDCQVEGSLPFFNETSNNLGFNDYLKILKTNKSLLKEARENFEDVHKCKLFELRKDAEHAICEIEKENEIWNLEYSELINWDYRRRTNDLRLYAFN